MSGITTAVSAHGKTDFLYAFNQGMISLEMPFDNSRQWEDTSHAHRGFADGQKRSQ